MIHLVLRLRGDDGPSRFKVTNMVSGEDLHLERYFMTVGDLRTSIAEQLKVSPQDVAIYNKGKVIPLD